MQLEMEAIALEQTEFRNRHVFEADLYVFDRIQILRVPRIQALNLVAGGQESLDYTIEYLCSFDFILIFRISVLWTPETGAAVNAEPVPKRATTARLRPDVPAMRKREQGQCRLHSGLVSLLESDQLVIIDRQVLPAIGGKINNVAHGLAHRFQQRFL